MTAFTYLQLAVGGLLIGYLIARAIGAWMRRAAQHRFLKSVRDINAMYDKGVLARREACHEQSKQR